MNNREGKRLLMKHIEKGEFGYIASEKKKYLTKIILYIIIALGIFFIGLLLNKFSKANIFTVLAILVVLPWARAVVGYVVLIPYKSVSRERYEKVKAVISDGQKLYTDMVITSPETSMELDFIVKGDGAVIGLMGEVKKGFATNLVMGKDGQDINYVSKYLTKGCRNWMPNCRVKIYESNMEEKFIRAVKEMEEHETDPKEDEELMSFLHSIIV